MKAIAFILLIALTNLSFAEESTGGGYDYKAVEKAERDKINQAKARILNKLNKIIIYEIYIFF